MTQPLDFEREFARLTAEFDNKLDELVSTTGAFDPGARSSAGLEQGSRPHKRKPRLPEAKIYTLRVDLRDSHPPIWRRFEARSDISLETLHLAIQGAFDWANYHLYRFSLGHPFDRQSEMFLCQWDADEGEEEGLFVEDVYLDETLQQPGDRLDYVYDFGDNWGLKIKLEAVRDLHSEDEGKRPIICVYGRRAAPPEDCGSLRDAESLAQVLPDPELFEIDSANDLIESFLDFSLKDPFVLPDLDSPEIQKFWVMRDMIARCSSALTANDLIARFQSLESEMRYRDRGSTDDPDVTLAPLYDEQQIDFTESLSAITWFLSRVGDGIKLTQAGYLPPAVVREVEEVILPSHEVWWSRKGGESHVVPVRAFRSQLMRLGLLRKSQGSLLLTRAGRLCASDPSLLKQHLVTRWATLAVGASAATDVSRPTERDSIKFESDALLFALLVAASGHGSFDLDHVAILMTNSGWRHDDGRPINYGDVAWTGMCPAHLLTFIAPLNDRGWMHRHISPAAVAITRATLLEFRKG